ncbi:hypothetical protein ABN238_17650 [Providencia rettgeri]|uniref:hypothetical protein n=1 Tax=Providencia rettgeri TaxID=587 RepID=UPI0032DA59EC
MKKPIEIDAFNLCEICHSNKVIIHTEGSHEKVFNYDKVECCGCDNTGHVVVEAEDCTYIEWEKPIE